MEKLVEEFYHLYFSVQDGDVENLAEWIGEQNLEGDGGSSTTQEFDQFLAERAAAGDTKQNK